MRTQLPLALLTATLTCSLVTAPAHARARVFVASYGDDANPCTFGSPCKTFQVAVNAVDTGGEVTAIDSAGFGPISINKAVAITSPDGVEAGIVPTAGGNAITIAAGASDAIVLRGLTLNGSGIGSNGIVFNSGGSLTVTNCVAQNFAGSGRAGNGILIQPTSGSITFAITNTILTNNGSDGIQYSPPSGSPFTNGVIDRAVATGNNSGIEFFVSGSADVAISNSIASNNRLTGIFAGGGNALTLSIDNMTINGNPSAGIDATIPASVLLSRSTIQGNGHGIENATSNTFYTYGNNLIDLNGLDGGNSLNLTKHLQ
jgi:hypothetical protein